MPFLKDDKTPWGLNQVERERFRSGQEEVVSCQPIVIEVVAHDVIDREDQRKHNEETKEDPSEDYSKAVVTAAATAGGILGCLMGGIVCAVVGALGSSYAAKNKAGTCVGDCARAMGELYLVAQDKAVALDQKHHIVHHSKQTVGHAWEKAKEMDRQYNICEKSQNALVQTGHAAINVSKGRWSCST